MIVTPDHCDGSITVAIGIKKNSKVFNPKRALVMSFIPLDETYNLSNEFPWLSINLCDKKIVPGNVIEDWFIQSRYKKPLVPLVEDWGVAFCLLDYLLGKTADNTPLVNKFFDPRRRLDLLAIRHFLMDNAYNSGQEYPFSRNPDMSGLGSKLGVKGFKYKNLYAEAEKIATLYRALNTNFVYDMPRKHQVV